MNKLEIINQWKLDRVFQELEQGNMRIPRFQRAYVWERSKIVKLLNSINKEYPIGSFFLWETDPTMETLGRDISEFGFPSKPQGNHFMFILDGQQRITSLYVALKGKTLNGIDYSRICYNLDKKEFTIPRLKTEQHNIPVWQIWNNLEYQKILVEYASAQDSRVNALMECHSKLQEYPVSIIMSRSMNLEEVVDIFERINQGGKRLSLFDLVHATVWSSDFDLRSKIDTFNEEIAIKLWGKLGSEIFAQSLALNVKEDCTKLVQLKLTTEECVASWDKTIECIRRAIDYVKSLGAQQLAILPYANIIPVLQYYLYKGNYKGIQPEHKSLIEDWFWTLTFSNRYSSSTLTRMNEDAKWIDSLIEGNTESRVFSVTIQIDTLRRIRMNNASVIKNGILCLMARNQPLDFDNGQIVTLDNTNASRANSKENHHFFPYSLHSNFNLSVNDINSVLNFAFISKRLNLEILNKRPSVYLSAYENKDPKLAQYIESHFISHAALEAAKSDDFNTFILERGKSIVEQINNVCKVGEKTTISLDDNIDTDDILLPDDDILEETLSFPEN